MTTWSDLTPEQREQRRLTNLEASRRYRQTPKYEAAQERFKATKKRSVTAVAARRRLEEEHPEIVAAWTVVATAIRHGTITKPSSCQRCQRAVRLDGHHHRGYAEEHQLDVLWLCRRCHKAAHREGVIE